MHEVIERVPRPVEHLELGHGGGSCLSSARVSGVAAMSSKSCSAEVFVNSRQRPSFVATALCHSAFLVASLELAALGVVSLLLASYSLLDMGRVSSRCLSLVIAENCR